MHYLLYGEDTYSIRERVFEIESDLRQKSPELEVVKLDGERISKESLMATMFVFSFFSSSKLIIIKNFIADCTDKALKDYLADNLEKIPEGVSLILAESGKVDSRLVLFKKLSQKGNAESFAGPSPIELSRWIDRKAKQFGATIAPAAKSKLLFLLGTDRWRMENEIQKLALYSLSNGSDEIAPVTVDLMIRSLNSTNIFSFIDALAANNLSRSLHNLAQLRNLGENDHYLLSMIIYQYRQMLIVADFINQGQRPEQAIGSAKLNPFVARKIMPLMRSHSFGRLRKIYQELLVCDKRLKNSGFEQEFALDVLVMKIAKDLV